MVELIQVFQDFERDSVLLMPAMLLGAGAIITIMGLVILLGGSALRRVSLLIVGTVVGFVFAFTVVEVSWTFALLVGLLAGGIGALFDKPAIGILTAVLFLSIAFCFLARPFVEAPDPEGSAVTEGNQLGLRQSWVFVQSQAVTLDARVSEVFWKMPKLFWAILGGVAVLGGVLAMKFQRTSMAFCFGISGTIFIFVGMVLVLLQRSVAAISKILGKPALYMAVFGGMVVLGMCVQLIFCRLKKGASGKDEESDDGSSGSSSGKKSWRTS